MNSSFLFLRIQLLCVWNILDGEADSSHLILAKTYHGHLVPQCQHILNAVDSLLRNLGNVNHSLLARCELNKRAKFLDTYNGSGKDLAFLEIGCDGLDHAN